MRGHLTEKANVFIVALEIVSGRPNADSSLEEEKIYLLEWVCKVFLHSMYKIDCYLSLIEWIFVFLL